MKNYSLYRQLERNRLIAMSLVCMCLSMATVCALTAFRYYRQHTTHAYIHYQGKTLPMIEDRTVH